jgi:hypothetical protein
MRATAKLLNLIAAAGLMAPALSTAQAQVPAHAIKIVAPNKAKPKVQIAILLDTSNSMDGLINQAKSELWTIVNRFSSASYKGKPAELEVALFEYGKDSIPAGEVYLRMVRSFTSDLDQLSEDLFALTTNGGSEYAGMVIDRATEGLPWSANPNDYKAVFIAGNEPFTQGPVPYAGAIAKAVGKGIVVNTIHCGDARTGIAGKWQDGARLGEGNFLTIEHNARIAHIATPYDKEIQALNTQLNRTYIGYGSQGRKKVARQRAQDANAASMGAGSAVSRAITKGGRSYKNSDWDLVDAAEDGVDVGAVEGEALPAPMRKMSAKQRKDFVAKKAKERRKIQRRIHELGKRRAAYIKKEEKKRSKSRKPSTFDKAVKATVKTQLESKGYAF